MADKAAMFIAADKITLTIKKVPFTLSVLLFGHIKEKEAGLVESGFLANWWFLLDKRVEV